MRIAAAAAVANQPNQSSPIVNFLKPYNATPNWPLDPSCVTSFDKKKSVN